MRQPVLRVPRFKCPDFGALDRFARYPSAFSVIPARSLRSKAFNRIYETVGCVKCFLRTLLRALGKRAPFRSIRKGFAIVNPGSLLIVRSELSVRPKHLFDRLRP